MEWTSAATLVGVIAAVTATGAWAFPKIRAMTWLIGALCITLVALAHAAWSSGPPPPGNELFSFYCIAAILLAIGAWERARRLG